MSYEAAAFNQDIRSWDVSRVIQKTATFTATSHPHVHFLPDAWDNVNDISDLFNGPDVED
jgi:hypothetical protein